MKPTAAQGSIDRAPAVPRENGEGVAAVERAFAILAAVERADHPVTLAELALRTGFYKSTILRLLSSLIATGYVTRLRDGCYDLGPTAFRLGAAFERKNAIRHHVMPELQRLVDRGTESASFHVRQDETTRLCLFRVNSRHSTLDRIAANTSYPLARGAAGHVIRAFSGDDDDRCDMIRKVGYCLSLGERDPACAALAAPVFGSTGALVGVVSLSGPRERYGVAEVAAMREQIANSACALTETLGGTWPFIQTPAD